MSTNATTFTDQLHELLLKFFQSKSTNRKRPGMEGVRLASRDLCHFKLVYDDRCPLVGRLANIVKLWDRFGYFTFIGWNNHDPIDVGLLSELEKSQWSLLLIDDCNERWSGPNAIPFILKNLPFGKMAAVLYTLPGTMWFTHAVYMLVSRNHRKFA